MAKHWLIDQWSIPLGYDDILSTTSHKHYCWWHNFVIQLWLIMFTQEGSLLLLVLLIIGLSGPGLITYTHQDIGQKVSVKSDQFCNNITIWKEPRSSVWNKHIYLANVLSLSANNAVSIMWNIFTTYNPVQTLWSPIKTKPQNYNHTFEKCRHEPNLPHKKSVFNWLY